MDRPNRRAMAVGGLIALLTTVVAGCNLSVAQPTPDLRATFAAETVVAQLTIMAMTAQAPTQPPIILPTATEPPPTVAPSPTSPATATLPPTATPGCTDRISATVIDVTVPDDTNMAAGASFTKTWRLTNAGTCSWDTGYALVFFDGNAMGGPASVNLTASVPPNSTVDVSVNLVAPTTNGTHTGNWKLRNSKGLIFGVGSSGGPFWVRIVVGPTATPAATVYKTGHLDVPQTYVVDLDQGTVSPAAADEDLWFHAVSAVEKYLEPRNSALIKKWTPAAPSYENCKGASLGASPIPLADVPAGSWICYKTAQGRYGRLEVEGLTAGPVQTMSIDFRTWQ